MEKSNISRFLNLVVDDFIGTDSCFNPFLVQIKIYFLTIEHNIYIFNDYVLISCRTHYKIDLKTYTYKYFMELLLIQKKYYFFFSYNLLPPKGL